MAMSPPLLVLHGSYPQVEPHCHIPQVQRMGSWAKEQKKMG